MNIAELLPPTPRPPHDPTFYLLNAATGWRVSGDPDDAEIGGDGIRLALAASSPVIGVGPICNFGGLTLPPRVAVGPDCEIYLMDAAAGAVRRFDDCLCAFLTVPCTGGVGSGARQVNRPQGIGVFGGDLYVCDTGNSRVSVFTRREFALRIVWNSPPGLPAPWEPTRIVFDAKGRAFVADRANRLIHRIRRTGLREAPLGVPGVVREMAFDCHGRLLIRLRGEGDVRIVDAETGAQIAVAPAGDLPKLLPPTPFPTDADGNLDLRGCCAEDSGVSGYFTPDGLPITPPAPPDLIYRTRGTLILGPLDSRLSGCVWHRVVVTGALPPHSLLQFETFAAEAERPADFVGMLPDSAWASAGATGALDKRGAWDTLIRGDAGRYLYLRLTLRGDGKTTPLVQSLRVEYPRISLRRYLPAVFGADPISADFTDRFLAVFDTTFRSIETQIDRQAALFDPDSAPTLSSDGATNKDRDFLAFIASWIGLSLDRNWPEARRRAWVKAASRLYPLRGTPEGLHRALLLYLGMKDAADCCLTCRHRPCHRCEPLPRNCGPEPETCCPPPAAPPLILEHYRLRRWLFVGAGRLGDESVLWGKSIVNRSQLDANAQADVTRLDIIPDPYRDPFHVYAHQATVYVPARAAEGAARRGLETLLRSEIPAHVRCDIVSVPPRFRIGVQACIGLDSVVGRYPEPGLLSGGAGATPAPVTLGATVLAGTLTPEVGAARIGRTTRLIKG